MKNNGGGDGKCGDGDDGEEMNRELCQCFLVCFCCFPGIYDK